MKTFGRGEERKDSREWIFPTFHLQSFWRALKMLEPEVENTVGHLSCQLDIGIQFGLHSRALKEHNKETGNSWRTPDISNSISALSSFLILFLPLALADFTSFNNRRHKAAPRRHSHLPSQPSASQGMEDKLRLLVLYASQTGNAMDAAEHVGREAECRACRAVVLSMDDYNASFLPHEGTVIFTVSSTGQGDTPDSMKFVAKKLDKRLADLGARPIIE